MCVACVLCAWIVCWPLLWHIQIITLQMKRKRLFSSARRTGEANARRSANATAAKGVEIIRAEAAVDAAVHHVARERTRRARRIRRKDQSPQAKAERERGAKRQKIEATNALKAEGCFVVNNERNGQ